MLPRFAEAAGGWSLDTAFFRVQDIETVACPVLIRGRACLQATALCCYSSVVGDAQLGPSGP